MATTQSRDLTRNLFSTLLFDNYNSESLFSSNNSDNENNIDNMADSSATVSSSDDNTNPFAFKIDLKDKIGNLLYLKVIQGLDDV